MAGIRRLVEEYETFGVRAVGVFPAGTFPQVPINDKKMYPLYAKCVELGIPVFCCAGSPALVSKPPASTWSSSTRSCSTFRTWSS